MSQQRAVDPSISSEAITAFAAGMRGTCIMPGDAAYDAARRVWNGGIEKYPAIIAQCEGVADVIAAVNLARTHDLPLAVRGGGHNVAGHGTCDKGIVVDLGAMNAVRVEVAARRVRAEGGATIGHVDRETQAFGLAVPLGIVSCTGIGGLTLCGGHSWLNRKHGFACDNLVSVDVVTADGRYLNASQSENADLFWAVRGGGGNFGVVTSFEFEAHPIGPDVTLAAAFYPIEIAEKILRLWRDFVCEAPDEFTSQVAFWSVPEHDMFPTDLQGREVVIASGMHCGPLAEGEDYIRPLRHLAEPLLDLSGPIPYLAAQQAFDPFFNTKAERLNYWKSIYLDALDDQAIERIAARARSRPNPWTLIPLRHLGGADSRVPGDATALGGCDASFLLSIETSWTDPAESDRAIRWTRSFWDEMCQGSPGSTYLNFVGAGEDSEAMLRAAYGDANYDRLVEIKSKYDPTNLFRLNQNIQPRQG